MVYKLKLFAPLTYAIVSNKNNFSLSAMKFDIILVKKVSLLTFFLCWCLECAIM